jgi:tRNA modification GTPase
VGIFVACNQSTSIRVLYISNLSPYRTFGLNQHFSEWNDTIAAIATPAGVGALGIIRLSGEDAISIANRLFPAKNLHQQPSHTLHVGYLKNNNQILDEVVVSLYRTPRSFTGEDVVELTCHGSPFVLEQVLQACLQQGARLAKPGEFTQRAFLNGKMDLAQAESVADIIAANTAAAQQTALQHLRGGFSQDLQLLREELIRFSALIELELDFSGEDVEFADRMEFKTLIGRISKTVTQLLESFKLGNAIKQGIQVAIIGKPNAGKSTLLNALLNEERAIVSDIPGTTRDTIEETINIGGILFRLIDTAGIRSSKGDVIEDIGIERSKANAAKADIVLHLKDLTDTSGEEESWMKEWKTKTLLVFNKSDAAVQTPVAEPENLYISARNKQGIEELKQAVYDKAIGEQIHTESTIVTNARHYHALQKVADSLQEIQAGMQNNLPGDLLALDIRTCLHHLGTITGQITHEDQLDFIFSKFCIGK